MLVCAALLMTPPHGGTMQTPLNKWVVVSFFADMHQCNPDYPSEIKAPGAPAGFAWDTLCVCNNDPRLSIDYAGPTALPLSEPPNRQ